MEAVMKITLMVSIVVEALGYFKDILIGALT